LSKTSEAAEILASFGLPRAQQNERSAFTLLALASVRPKTPWKNAKASLLRTVDIMSRITEHRGQPYKPNTREIIRRQSLHQFEQARIVDRNPDDPARPTNSGKNAYQLTPDALRVIQTYGKPGFHAEIAGFIARHRSLAASYDRVRKRNRVPLKMPDGATVYLSPGPHNVLQVAIVQQFGPRFAPGADVLYVGDTARKHVVFAADRLKSLNVPITQHDKLPDVVLYWPEKKWLFLIEAVTSHGPVSPKRHAEFERMLSSCTTERVYVTAFLDTKGFKKYAGEIAWETEVWIADKIDHMIHFNGPKFLGPYKPRS
jgi:adenine-specific DNA-methyltransferase